MLRRRKRYRMVYSAIIWRKSRAEVRVKIYI